VDFFFSGHVGFAVINALYNFEAKNYYLGAFAIFSVVLEFATMIFLRAHFSIDLISGIVFGHYSWLLTGKLIDALEEKYEMSKKE